MFKLEIDGTQMQLSIPKAQNVFLPTNMPVQRVFFFSQYFLHYSPYESLILKAEEDWGE